jgi:AraC-like DNA-binding protein
MVRTMASAAQESFREPAAQPAGMKVFSSGARVLFIGPSLGLTPHRNAVGVIALGIDGSFGVANDPDDPSAGYRNCRSVLIPPNTLHHLAGMTGRMAFLYVDAKSRDLAVLRELAGERTARADFDLRIEGELLEWIDGLANGSLGWPDVRRMLAAALGTSSGVATDRRVARTLETLHADPSSRTPLSELASEAELSPSRLLHLFKGEVGVPLRRYKLWIAMGAATRSIARGETLTTAALGAGFASSAHFSATFREMFGIEPSRLSRGKVEIVDDNAVPPATPRPDTQRFVSKQELRP